MSLHTIVQRNFAGRLRLRRVIPARAAADTAAAGTTALPLLISISSMRVLETGLALSAIATALLIGLGR